MWTWHSLKANYRTFIKEDGQYLEREDVTDVVSKAIGLENAHKIGIVLAPKTETEIETETEVGTGPVLETRTKIDAVIALTLVIEILTRALEEGKPARAAMSLIPSVTKTQSAVRLLSVVHPQSAREIHLPVGDPNGQAPRVLLHQIIIRVLLRSLPFVLADLRLLASAIKVVGGNNYK